MDNSESPTTTSTNSASEQSKDSQRRFAAFDIDGTLIRWQLYHAVVDRLAKQNLLGESADKRLHEARMVWKRREYKESFKDYEKALIGVYEEALGDITTETFDEVARQVADEYKDQVYTYTRDLITELKKDGYILLAISGSHEELVGYIAQNFGFDYWVGTQYEREGSSFTGNKFIASSDKKSVLSKLIEDHKLSTKDSVAVGDSLSDVSMLEMVESPIAFNPDQQLFDIATSNGWEVVIERKNVIYKLRNNDGKYILA